MSRPLPARPKIARNRTQPLEDDSVESVRRALVSLRRLFQRKDLAEQWAAAYGDTEQLDYASLRLLDAVQACEASAPSGQGATVGDVARILGLDPSRASRVVAAAVANGCVGRRAVQGDGRKMVLEVTNTGQSMLTKGREVTRARIAMALDGWAATDRRRFNRLLARFVEGLDPSPPRK